MAEVKVDGVFASDLGYVGALAWETRWPGGCWEAGWTLLPHAGTPLATLRPGALVEVFEGLIRVWVGTLFEARRGDGAWDCVALGLSRSAEDYLALFYDTVDLEYRTTNVPQLAIERAIDDGIGWAYNGDAPPAVTVDGETEGANTLAQLLDAACEAAGLKWGIFADGAFYAAADPTTAALMVDPLGAPQIGSALDGQASHIFARYVSAETGTPAVPSEWSIATAFNEEAATRWRRREKGFDLRELGLLAGLDAEALADARLAESAPRLGLTDPVDASTLSLTTLGDVVPHLAFVGAFGPMALRLHGVLDPLTNLASSAALDVVIGRVVYEDGSTVITLAPQGMPERTFRDVMEYGIRKAVEEPANGVFDL